MVEDDVYGFLAEDAPLEQRMALLPEERKGIPSPVLVAGMKMAGYRYAKGRGFYR